MESPAKKIKIKKTERAMQYFTFSRTLDQKKEMYICNTCDKEINGTKRSNLTSHLEVCHQTIFAALDKECDVIEYKRQKLLFDAVEMVSVNGRAFHALNDSAIKSMNEEVLKELQSAGRPLNLKDTNLPEVKELLQIVSVQIREHIQAESKGLPLCLMIDIGTSGGRSILGIRIQFILNGKLVLRSIGMVELKESHTGELLANTIVKQLGEFGIDCRQCVTMTTDNGANVLKSVKDLDSHLQIVDDDAQIMPETPRKKKANANEEPKENEMDDDDAIDREIEAALALSDEMTDDNAYDILFDETTPESDENCAKNDLLLESITDELNAQHGINTVWKVTGVSCNVHTLQLSVRDTFKATTIENQNIIKLSQKVAKILRVSSIRSELGKAGIHYKYVRLAVTTRWCSEYLMVIEFHFGFFFDNFDTIFQSQ